MSCIKWLSNLTAQVPLLEPILLHAATVPKDSVWYGDTESSPRIRNAWLKSYIPATHHLSDKRRTIETKARSRFATEGLC